MKFKHLFFNLLLVLTLCLATQCTTDPFRLDDQVSVSAPLLTSTYPALTLTSIEDSLLHQHIYSASRGQSVTIEALATPFERSSCNVKWYLNDLGEFFLAGVTDFDATFKSRFTFHFPYRVPYDKVVVGCKVHDGRGLVIAEKYMTVPLTH